MTRAVRARMSCACGLIYGPVSYTHLDVYKRQGPTRAQVQAELQQAKVSGQYTFGEEGYPAAIASKSSLTAQQVQEQLAQAKNAGEDTFGNICLLYTSRCV